MMTNCSTSIGVAMFVYHEATQNDIMKWLGCAGRPSERAKAA